MMFVMKTESIFACCT